MSTVIAIVEDEIDQRENYRDVLTAHGYEVRVYADRPSAEAGFERELPDLALLDIMLGEDMDGGFDLTGAKYLELWARGEYGFEKMDIGVGLLGSDTAFPDSSKTSIKGVALTSEWARYRIQVSEYERERYLPLL